MNHQTAKTQKWLPVTLTGAPIEAGQRYLWCDLSHHHAPRKVTVDHLDETDGLVICKDDTQTHYMVVPEELHELN